MSSAPYDQSLLAQAPVATRAQLQEGYDSVLLAPNRRRIESDPALDSKEGERRRNVAPPPFRAWRKPVLGLLITLVVIAAILGAALGATARKRAHTSTGTDTAVQVGTGTPASASIFGAPTTTSSSTIPVPSSSLQPASPFAESIVAIATLPSAVSGLFPQVTARHFVTARRR